MVHKLPFHKRQQGICRFVQSVAAKLGIAALIVTLALTAFVTPAFATSGEVLTTSGYGDGYYYECTYTPSYEKKSAYSSGNYHSYYANGYHIECQYTYNMAPVKKTPQKPVASQMPATTPSHPVTPKQNHHYYNCTYTVMQGDNISSIAYYYGITYTRLAKANYLKYPYYIFPGDVLHVPCKKY